MSNRFLIVSTTKLSIKLSTAAIVLSLYSLSGLTLIEAQQSSNNLVSRDRQPPAITSQQANQYLAYAEQKVDAGKPIDAEYVLKFLLSANGVPETVRERADHLMQSFATDANAAATASVEVPATSGVATNSSDSDSIAADTLEETNASNASRLSRLGILNSAAANATANYDNADSVLLEVEKRLNGFRSNTGRYPLGYQELNQLLPAGEPPLDSYNVIYYVSRYGGFIITVRDKDDPSTEVTIQRTGLIK